MPSYKEIIQQFFTTTTPPSTPQVKQDNLEKFLMGLVVIIVILVIALLILCIKYVCFNKSFDILVKNLN